VRKIIWIITILTLVSSLTAVVQSSYATLEWQGKVDVAVLNATAAGHETEFLIILTEQADLSGAAALPTKEAKGHYVYATLTAVARRSQQPLLAYLQEQGIAHRSYWVSNMIWAKGDATVVQTIAQRVEVATIAANPWVQLAPQLAEEQRNRGDSPNLLVAHPPLSTLHSSLSSLQSTSAPEWNLEQINATDVWALDNRGQEVVIGGQDTGFDWTHPGLLNQYRGWDGTTADHDYNWHDAIHSNNPMTQPGNSCGFDAATPCDDQQHGTHTMGIMVGDDGQGNQTGVAPNAQWIGCRNMEEAWGSPASYSECFEWFIAPYPLDGDPMSDGDPDRAPHVINNSWSCPTVEGCTMPDVLRPVVEAVRVAGIVTVQSAGNSGPGCQTISTPAAIYEASFTVGATGPADTIAAFSSRGPVTADGSGRLKPNITAPGVSIRSTVPGGSYSLSSGTSMAAPHIAGVVALLIAAEPSLAGQVDQLEGLIEQTAVPLTTSQGCGADESDTIPNHVFGWGRVDALAAVEAIAPPPPPCYRLTLTHSGSGSDPVATTPHSPDCGEGTYQAGAMIELTAAPAAGWLVAGWQGTSNDDSDSSQNSLIMPAHDHSASVIYTPIPEPENEALFLPLIVHRE
jgi:subtilisin family serine protease